MLFIQANIFALFPVTFYHPEILTASIVLNGFWKQSSLAATSVTSALEVIFNEMRYINLRFTYFTLLTYTPFSWWPLCFRPKVV